MNHPTKRTAAFTLIELLVVVSIIVLLLAMLAPAMDKAIYQAELAKCGANQKAVTSAVTLYAFDHKRFYPYRPMCRDLDPGYRPIPMNRMTFPQGTGGVDDRPVLKGYVNVRDMLYCPLSPEVDLEIDSANDTSVFAPYNLFFGWQYLKPQGGTNINGTVVGASANGTKGMFKVGDKLGWSYGFGNTGSYSTLIGDYNKNGNTYADGAHPDKLGKWNETEWQRVRDAAVPTGYNTRGWYAGAPSRVDLNFGLADGAVLRYVDADTLDFVSSGLKEIGSFRDGAYGHKTAVPAN